jgi:acetolactate synthase I/II/III large subunit
MGDSLKLRTGGQHVVDALLAQGTDRVFGVPGESYLDVLDALHAQQHRVRFITCRHEGAAAFMAEAHGKLTGRPGICLVTRAPGAANASIGVHTAFQDSTPLILLIGQVGRDMMEREAFQEVDYRQMFGPIAKWVAQIDDVSRVAEFMMRAYAVALSGRPGPVVLALPEDMLTDSAPATPSQPVVVAPSGRLTPSELAPLQQALAQAHKPLLLLGGSTWSDAGLQGIRAFATRQQIPLACAFRRQDLCDNRHDSYVGEVGIGINPELAQAIRDCDLLLAVGTRLGEIVTSGYTLLEVPLPRQTLVHVMSAAEELGRVYQSAIALQSSLDGFAHACAALEPVVAPDPAARSAWQQKLRANYQRYIEPPWRDVRLDPARVIIGLRERLELDAIVTNGAGNYSAWAHRYHQFSSPRCQLAPTSGAMGYGVPAAIAAKLHAPQRQVICLAGDGCFLMTSQELATVRQNRLAIVFIVFNNGMYGTIRMHQETHYPGHMLGTDLCNPDFVAYAASFGIAGERVEHNEGFAPALDRALSCTGSYMIELSIDPEVLSPRASLSGLRQASLRASA